VNVETVINIYLTICMGMIMFNIVYAYILVKKDKRIIHISSSLEHEILSEINHMALSLEVQESHKNF